MDPLWITYAWKDDNEGDFGYLVQELGKVGINAIYDKVALVPGVRLWDQIADKITSSALSGWAYLLTPHSLESEACREELAYALDRALRAKGGDFPLIGLLHAVPIEEVPPALRVRLCVSLANPDWREEVAAGIERRQPRRKPEQQTKYVWKQHRAYLGKPEHIAIEVRPRFEQMTDWRLVVPATAKVVQWGRGNANGGVIGGVKMMVMEGTVELDGTPCRFVGTGDAVSPSLSAYIVFDGELPAFVAFGRQTPSGAISDLEAIQPQSA